MKKKLRNSVNRYLLVVALIFTAGCKHESSSKLSNHDSLSIANLSLVMYTCPMPEDSIFSEKPGTCPKCGMDLVKMENHDHNNETINQPSDAEKQTFYTCPMHPEIIKDKPGRCPVCGMDLVEKIENTNAAKLGLGDIMEPVNEVILASVKTVKPERKTLSQIVESHGYITYNPKNTRSIASRYAGRIEKLYVKYNFEEIRKGQKLMDIYSPELITAQENLLYALDSDEDNSELINVAKQKLALLGMTSNQINALIQSKKVNQVMSIYATENGHIHEMKSLDEISMPIMQMNRQSKEMNYATENGEFSTKEGMYIAKGQAIFSVIGTEKLWAILKIYPEDISKIKLNQPVEIYSEMQSEKTYEDKIEFIEPTFESDSKYLNARVYLENCDHHQLKIGSLIKARIKVADETGLWIPKTSVLDLGNNRYAVFFKSATSFKAKEVSIENRNENWVKLISGLETTDEIALQAQYLIDSEGFIKFKK